MSGSKRAQVTFILSAGGREAASLGRGGPAALEVVAGGGVPAVGVAGRWVEVRDDLFFFHFSIFFY
jgi:hypothetical protein